MGSTLDFRIRVCKTELYRCCIRNYDFLVLNSTILRIPVMITYIALYFGGKIKLEQYYFTVEIHLEQYVKSYREGRTSSFLNCQIYPNCWHNVD